MNQFFIYIIILLGISQQIEIQRKKTKKIDDFTKKSDNVDFPNDFESIDQLQQQANDQLNIMGQEEEEEEEVEEQEEEEEEDLGESLPDSEDLKIIDNQKFHFMRTAINKDPLLAIKDKPLEINEFWFHYNHKTLFYTKVIPGTEDPCPLEMMQRIQGAIDFTDLIVQDIDSPESCCQKVQIQAPYYSEKIHAYVIDKDSIEENNKLFTNLQSYYTCIVITGPLYIWRICTNVKLDIINQWYHNLQDLIIRANFPDVSQDLIKNSRSPVTSFYTHPSEDCYACKEFSWNTQVDWTCMCQWGENQSPIVLSKFDSVNLQNSRLIFEYQLSKNAQVSYEDEQIQILGKFGSMLHQIDETLRVYEAFKINIKFPSEHFIDLNQADAQGQSTEGPSRFDGEIQIHHVSLHGFRAVLSILFMYEDGAPPNDFFDRLKPEFWPPNISSKPYILQDEDPFSQNIEQNIDLMDIFMKNQDCPGDPLFDPSFFWYQGSETTPPCEEGVHHIILMNPQKMNTRQMRNLQQNSFDNKKNSGVTKDQIPQMQSHVYDSQHYGSNSRIPQPINNRTVYKSVRQKQIEGQEVPVEITNDIQKTIKQALQTHLNMQQLRDQRLKKRTPITKQSLFDQDGFFIYNRRQKPISITTRKLSKFEDTQFLKVQQSPPQKIKSGYGKISQESAINPGQGEKRFQDLDLDYADYAVV